MNTTVRQLLFGLALVACALPVTGTPAALVAGACFGMVLGNPWPTQTALWSKKLLQISVVGLGFGLGLGQVLRTGRDAFVYTIIGISLTMLLGRLLGRLLKVPSTTTTLISFGTAICGGSAIAAMSPVIGARDDETAVALATVFSLNAVALMLFPPMGHLVGLDQHQFGLWAALAIHDTSSVVGAAAAYGSVALAVGTTVKLARAVWIMPCSLAAAWITRSEKRTGIPLFIPGFVAAAGLRAAVPQALPVWNGLFAVARQSLVVTLFFIGAGLSRQVLRRLGVKPMLMGVLLWITVSLTTLGAILQGWIA